MFYCLPSLFSSLPLSLCVVYKHGYIWGQGPMHAEARVVWSSVLHLTFLVRVSHWTWNWKFPPGWQASDLPGSTCLYLPNAKAIGIRYHAWLFTWVLKIWTRVLLLLQQALLTTELSPEPVNIFLVFPFPFQSLFSGNSSEKIIAGSTFSHFISALENEVALPPKVILCKPGWSLGSGSTSMLPSLSL